MKPDAERRDVRIGRNKSSFAQLTSLVELERQPGPLAGILRCHFDLLAAADKWAEQNAEYQKRHNDPLRLPLADPWQFLIDSPGVAPGCKGVFRAAQSQIVALRHLCGMGLGRASHNTDWWVEAIKAKRKGDDLSFQRAALKLTNALMRFDNVQEHVRNQNDPKLTKEMEAHVKQRRKQLVHRGRRREAGPHPFPRLINISKEFPLAYCLIDHWIIFAGCDVPGLMFWSTNAMKKFVFAWLGKVSTAHKNLGLDYVERTRQRLGLIPVSRHSPWVWDVTITRMRNNAFKVEGKKRDGKPLLAFTAEPSV